MRSDAFHHGHGAEFMAQSTIASKSMTFGEGGSALAFAALAILSIVIAAKAYTPEYAFHAYLFAAASAATVFKIFDRYYDRPAELPPLTIDGKPEGELLVLGWGSTQGALIGGVNMARREGIEVSRAHLRWLNPLPSNMGEVLARFDKVLLPEMNLGQLALLLRAEFLVDAVSYSRVRGRPLSAAELEEAITAMAEGA